MARNRRLVPMPTREKPRTIGAPKVSYAGPSGPPIMPTFRNSWPYFAFLIVTAIVMYFAKWPILVIAAIVGIIQVWALLARRYPKTMWFLLGVIRGLMRR